VEVIPAVNRRQSTQSWVAYRQASSGRASALAGKLAAGRRFTCPVAVSTAIPEELPSAADFTERQGAELLTFILKGLDQEEETMFGDDLQQAVAEALRSNSVLPIARLLGDWEATVELKREAQLARELDEAIEESQALRRGRAG